jgi:nitrate reductase (NAD(P)H)
MAPYTNPSPHSEQWPEDVEWVKRDSRMWIHGRTNFETPPDLLDTLGFHTPAPMFFVRQHSAVPKVPAEGHEFHIEQLVGKATRSLKTIALADLQQGKYGEVKEITSCLVCSGQRRLELNLVEPTGGAISWHNSVGNATWTGVLLRDVLEACGVDFAPSKAKYCEFTGGEEHNYKGCLPFHKVGDPSGDVLLAWLQNGEPLLPDHGAPLRVIVPGYSAKTSVKWLTKVTVRDSDSEFGKHKSYYKFLPATMRPGTEEYKEHLTDPEYTVTELNINSVMFEPHNFSVARKGPVNVTGYCFTGGGRTVARIEVSKDGGATWAQCRNLDFELSEHGRLWSWVRFQHAIDFDPAVDTEIVCRAWDCAANTQPADPVWNYTGMMNNSQYRIKVVPNGSEFCFVHPTTWKMKDYKLPAPRKTQGVVVPAGDAAGRLAGRWSIGDFEDSVVELQVDGASFSSVERRWGGDGLTGTIGDGLQGTLGPFGTFGIDLEECEGGHHILRWRNGAVWTKL